MFWKFEEFLKVRYSGGGELDAGRQDLRIVDRSCSPPKLFYFLILADITSSCHLAQGLSQLPSLPQWTASP